MLSNITKEELEKCGVYQIKCIQTDKIYIGSTVVNFSKRLNHHIFSLKNNKHKNSHLQNAFNKYGDFEITILEFCNKENCLLREQYYLDLLLKANLFIEGKDCYFKDKGFNINPLATGTPNLSKEVINKRSKTFKKYVSSASEYYQKLKNFEIDFDEIPEEYLSIINGWINNIPWNKGKNYESTEHLKVKKNLTKEFVENRKNQRISAMNKIKVFDNKGNFLKIFENAFILEEWSKTVENNFPIVSRFKGSERMGVPLKHLQYSSIIKAAKSNKPYKGLIFKYVTP